jgi:predicted methyltransferase
LSIGQVGTNNATSMRTALAYLLAVALAGCGSSPPPDPIAPPEPPPVEPEPAPIAAPEPVEPSAEELAKEKALQQLEAERRKLETEHAAELKRWTPELRAEAKALAEKKYPSTRAALKSVLAGKHRRPVSVERDPQRRPLETLTFFGFAPTQTVLEYGPGEGWYTELLAPALASRGKLIVTSTDPNGPASERSTLYARRLQLFLEKSPEAYGKVETIIIDPKAPKLGLEGSVDLAIVIRGMHGMHNNKLLDGWLAEFHRALKPKGVLGVVQHRAPADADIDQSSKQGYLPEPWLIEKIEASGFKLAAKSELNANPKDTRQHPDGVWSLPPTLRSGDPEKYANIGESDRMTLKFVKRPAP